MLVKQKIINWVISLLNDSFDKEIHVFCLDFSSAMLANIISAEWTLDYLSKENMQFFTAQVINLFSNELMILDSERIYEVVV